MQDNQRSCCWMSMHCSRLPRQPLFTCTRCSRRQASTPFCVVGLEDFIAMKCFAGGPQNLLDARSAYFSASGPIDLDLMRRPARRFGRDAADHLEQILAR